MAADLDTLTALLEQLEALSAFGELTPEAYEATMTEARAAADDEDLLVPLHAFRPRTNA